MASRNITIDDVITTARLYNVPPELALAVWDQESGQGRNTRTSPKGAVGGFQVMPGTFKDMLPNGDIYNPVDNMVAGIKYLAKGLQKSGGDPEGAAQFYYHGSVLPAGRAGPNSGQGTPTTRNYGQQIVARMGNVRSNNFNYEAPPEVDLGLFGSNGEEINNEEDMPDIAGLTRPLDQGNNDWMDQVGSREDYELDSYIRKLVDEEFSSRNT